ncbi:MAG: ThiF family adenylyltransferase [Chitinophagales bacterium]
MMSYFFHEQQYRSAETMKAIANINICICGAGALGANLAENLVRMGFKSLKIIDFDRIEAHNLSTQPYAKADIGQLKANTLIKNLYRATATRTEAICKRLTEDNVHSLLKKSDLVIDAFDNSSSRQIVTQWAKSKNTACLHIGLASDYAEIIWNKQYRVPSATNDDICDYPLARNLVMLTVATACEVIVGFVSKTEQKSYTITLADLNIKPYV